MALPLLVRAIPSSVTAIRRFIPLAAAALLLPGCYTMQPVPATDLREGLEVRTWITAEEAEALREVVPVGRRTLDGRVVRVDAADGSLLLSVPVGAVERSGVRRTLRQEVRIPERSLLEVETRELDRTRTYGLVAAAVAGVGLAIAVQLSRGGEGREEVVDPSPPAEQRHPGIPLIRIPVGGP